MVASCSFKPTCLQGPNSGRVISSEVAIVGQHRPRNARILVGQCYGRHIGVAPLQQLMQPIILLRLALRRQDHRARPVNQQRSQIRVAALAYTQKRRLAAAGVLLGNQPEPRGHLATVIEAFRIADGGHQCARCDRPDAGNLLQLAAGLIAPMPSLDLTLEFAHLPGELLEVIH